MYGDEYYLNRSLCDALREMRKACETSNYSYMPALIEEVQYMGNKMESGLEDKRSLRNLTQRCKEKAKELKALKDAVKDLSPEESEDSDG